jgi:hypothetical protein
MRIDRLQKCLAALPRKETKRVKFDLHHLITIDECGTTACACGWYKLKNPRVRIGTYIPANPNYSYLEKEDVAAHFGITYEDAGELFWFKNRWQRRYKIHNSLAGTRARLKAFIAEHKKAVRK